MKDYFFSEIKFQVGEERQEYDTYQLIVKEKTVPKKQLGKAVLSEASAFAKYGFVPLKRKHQQFHQFACRKSSWVELKFEARKKRQVVKANINFKQKCVIFSSASSSDHSSEANGTAAMPAIEDIQAIMESLYIGNHQKYLFFRSGRKSHK